MWPTGARAPCSRRLSLDWGGLDHRQRGGAGYSPHEQGLRRLIAPHHAARLSASLFNHGRRAALPIQRPKLMTGGLAITAATGIAWLELHDGAIASVSTKLQAELQTFPDHITSLRTSGFRASGDGGGALYQRSMDEPRHAGKFKSADGRWSELNETVVAPEMLGGTGDGRNDDYPSLVAALSVLRDGGVLRFTPGRTYRFLTGNGTALDANILSDRITIDGNGATLERFPASGILQDDPYTQYYRISSKRCCLGDFRFYVQIWFGAVGKQDRKHLGLAW